MTSIIDFSRHSESQVPVSTFWERVLNDEQLKGCTDLEKLVAGCELIVVLDEIDELLAA